MTLKEACEAILADPHLLPQQISGKLVTHCNQGARFVAQALGCHEFDDLNMDAEAMGRLMEANASGKWQKVGGAAATVNALRGRLGFAFMSAEKLKDAHAHIATIYPAPMEMSGSLTKEVPLAANIGKENVIGKVSKFFPVALGEPDYFVFIG